MIDVAIFAYNRPHYLRHCIESVRRNIPNARIRVYDDASDDPQQLELLETLVEEAVPVRNMSNSRHGNLYSNMNLALANAQHDHLLMLQDDMQIVRILDDTDFSMIARHFEVYGQSAFLSPLFMRGDRMRRYRRELLPNPDFRAYASAERPDMNRKNCLSYFDVHIANVTRLRTAGWQYDVAGENANRDAARAQFGRMSVMAEPFAFFCPEVPFLRHRTDASIAARYAARVVGSHLKYFHDLTDAEVADLRERDFAKKWPIAEDYLTCTDPKVVKPFVYKDVKARLWLYALHKLELRLKRKSV